MPCDRVEVSALPPVSQVLVAPPASGQRPDLSEKEAQSPLQGEEEGGQPWSAGGDMRSENSAGTQGAGGGRGPAA